MYSTLSGILDSQAILSISEFTTYGLFYYTAILHVLYYSLKKGAILYLSFAVRETVSVNMSGQIKAGLKEIRGNHFPSLHFPHLPWRLAL